MAAKLILDTDIGTDVDDAWALALCLASDEIELAGVSLVHADLETRAKIALEMLRLAGRMDIPVYKGLSGTLTPGGRVYWAGHEGANTDFSKIRGLAAREGAVDFILETVARQPGEVVVCSIGPMTNAADAIRREPDVMRRVKRLVIMASTFAGEGPDAASREHNACTDPVATKIVLESGIPALVVGLNVTTKVCVRSGDLPRVERSQVGQYLAAMTRQYYGVIGRDCTWMHDPLAVATVIDESLVTTESMAANVLDDGRVVYSRAAANRRSLDVCVDVDVGRFEELLLSEIRSLT